MSVCKKVVVKRNIKKSYARQWRGPQVGCSRSPPAGERHRDPGIPAPAPKIHQRKRMAQARRTTDLQPHPSPSKTCKTCKTQRNSSIIAIPNQPADPQTPPVAPHHHTRLLHHIRRRIYEVRQSQRQTHLQKPETTNP